MDLSELKERKIKEFREKDAILDHASKMVKPEAYAALIKRDKETKMWHLNYLDNWIVYFTRTNKAFLVRKVYCETFILSEHFAQEEWPELFDRLKMLEERLI